ncbi:MAG TPA: peptidoglycan-binding protein [bacterium]|nr:peptidoglycan-binding protein [bacterium]
MAAGYKQNLSKSKRNIIDVPKIIPRAFDYVYDSYVNTPKMILVIENKLIKNDLLNSLSTKNDGVHFNIDYEQTDPRLPNNIFNYFNAVHTELITFNDMMVNAEIDSEKVNSFGERKSPYKNGYYTNNYNFAYHYFIDKKGNIYEGRPHNIRAYNLDIFKYDEEEFNKPENKQYDQNTGMRILPLLDQGDFLFNDCLVILTEEQTDSMDTTNETYTALKSLLTYLIQYYNYNKFYTYSELKMIPHFIVDDPKEDIFTYNNPGMFFRVNELHSAVEHSKLESSRISKDGIIEIVTYGERDYGIKYNKSNPIKGNDILMLQKMLYKLDILKRYSNITGIYDKTTELAVAAFQKKYYVTPEYDYGVADKNTLETLRDKIYKEKISNSTIIDDNYNPFRVLEYIPDNMMTGYDVMILQSRLKRCIYPILEVNGIFDEYTKDAVSMFQAKYASYVDKNMVDGKVGPETWKSILECTDTVFVETNSEDNDPVVGSITPTHCRVSRSNIIYLQKAINKMLEDYKTKIDITGGYDEDTQRYIKLINENPRNREIIGIDRYPETKLLGFWESDYNLKTCYPAEYIWLIKHYLLNEKIELDLVQQD